MFAKKKLRAGVNESGLNNARGRTTLINSSSNDANDKNRPLIVFYDVSSVLNVGIFQCSVRFHRGVYQFLILNSVY